MNLPSFINKQSGKQMYWNLIRWKKSSMRHRFYQRKNWNEFLPRTNSSTKQQIIRKWNSSLFTYFQDLLRIHFLNRSVHKSTYFIFVIFLFPFSFSFLVLKMPRFRTFYSEVGARSSIKTMFHAPQGIFFKF